MSTKIYAAWRMPVSRLNEFLEKVGKQMLRRVGKATLGFMAAMKAEVVEKKTQEIIFQPRANDEKYVESIRKFARFQIVMDEAAKASMRLERHPFDFDCGFNVWLYKGRAYVIPWGEPWTRDKIRVPSWAEDYAYWNNTDRPNRVSQKAWDARGRTWSKFLPYVFPGLRLIYYVVDLSPTALHIYATMIQREIGLLPKDDK